MSRLDSETIRKIRNEFTLLQGAATRYIFRGKAFTNTFQALAIADKRFSPEHTADPVLASQKANELLQALAAELGKLTFSANAKRDLATVMRSPRMAAIFQEYIGSTPKIPKPDYTIPLLKTIQQALTHPNLLQQDPTTASSDEKSTLARNEAYTALMASSSEIDQALQTATLHTDTSVRTSPDYSGRGPEEPSKSQKSSPFALAGSFFDSLAKSGSSLWSGSFCSAKNSPAPAPAPTTNNPTELRL